MAVARHLIPLDERREPLLHFDFSRKLKVYMNGKELYHYEKQKLDRIFYGTYVISLRLKKGSNELIFITEGDRRVALSATNLGSATMTLCPFRTQRPMFATK